jgi:ATP-dependent Clp protease protease subunit
VYAGLGIYDTMQYIKPDVATICTGMAASMGRCCYVLIGGNVLHCHTQVMIHQPSGGAQGVATDGNQLERNVETERQLYKIISHHSGQTFDKETMKRDYWMIAEEAKAYGMIDEVLIKDKKIVSSFGLSYHENYKL